VALNRIEPESHSSTIKVSAAARNFGNIRVFLENLERSPRFSEVYLLNQSETKVGLTQQGILFSVSLRMNTR
jgi:type IV pilus assembly protein PilN